MIPYEQIDAALKSLGKDRAWLAVESGRKPDSIRVALAPNAPLAKRSELLQKALSDAIEREQARQAAEKSGPYIEPAPEIPAGHTAIYLTGQVMEDADRASRLVGSPSLAIFCRDIIRAEARRIIFESQPSLKVAEDSGKSSHSTHAPTAPIKYPTGKRKKKNG